MSSITATPEDADVIVEWPDGQRSHGRVTPVLSEYTPTEWLSGELLDHVRARGMSEREREAMRVQIADAETEFRMHTGRRRAPQRGSVPRVDVRVIRGRAGDERVLWLSHTEIADRMRALADRIDQAQARLTDLCTPPVERDALLHAIGYLSASMQDWTAQLRAEAERVSVGDGRTRHQPDPSRHG